MTSRPHNSRLFMASVVIWATRGVSADCRILAPFIKCLVGGRCLCWPTSLCGGRPFVHVLSICRPTCCYALILTHLFLLWLLYCCLVVLYPSRLKVAVVEDVHFHSKIIFFRKALLKTFHTRCLV